MFLQKSAFAGNPQSVTSLASLDGNAPREKYHKDVLNHFTEYPLSTQQSIGGTLQASYSNFKQSGTINSTSAYALNSVEIFHRYKIFSDKKLGIAVQNLYKFPGIYNENNSLGLPAKQEDYELRFLFAYNMQDRFVNQVVRGTNSYFFRPEIAYRRRFGNPFDEIRFAFNGGVKINPKFLVLFQDSIIWNVASKANVATNSYSNPSNFQFSKDANNIGTLSLIYRCNNEIALQAGFVKRLSGNAGLYDARGFIFGLWTSF